MQAQSLNEGTTVSTVWDVGLVQAANDESWKIVSIFSNFVASMSTGFASWACKMGPTQVADQLSSHQKHGLVCLQIVLHKSWGSWKPQQSAPALEPLCIAW